MCILTINHFPYLLQTAVQTLFVGHGHWICTSCSKASGVCIYDSLPPGKELPSDVQIQNKELTALYFNSVRLYSCQMHTFRYGF